MPYSPSIVIADDHPLVLKGLQDFLNEKGYNVEATANNGQTALKFIESLSPDIAILDIQMPFYSGIEIAKTCGEKGFKTKIIIITFEKDEKLYLQAQKLNVSGYVLKEFALTEIENCIEAIKNNKPYFSPELLKYLESFEPPKELQDLSVTERKVLELISKNKTGVQIAEIFSISPRTVEKHKSNIIRKLGLTRKQNSLVIWAKENENFL